MKTKKVDNPELEYCKKRAEEIISERKYTKPFLYMIGIEHGWTTEQVDLGKYGQDFFQMVVDYLMVDFKLKR